MNDNGKVARFLAFVIENSSMLVWKAGSVCSRSAKGQPSQFVLIQGKADVRVIRFAKESKKWLAAE